MKRITERTNRAGFTLVEVLIVVVILGILASIALPQFSVSSRDAKEAAFLQDLHRIRHQISVYKIGHEDTIPAQGTTDADKFVAQLTQRTDIDGAVNATGGARGPYITGQLPPNPYNNSRTVVVKNATLVPGDYGGSASHGWTYSSTSGEFRGNIDPAIKSVVETTQSVNAF